MPYTYLSPDGYLRVNSRYSGPLQDEQDDIAVWLMALDLVSSVGGLIFTVSCLSSLRYGHSRPILRWRIVMVTILCITGGLPFLSLITSGIISKYVSGHYLRLGQEVKADNLNSNSGKPDNPFTIWLSWTLDHLFYIACDLLQTLVFTIAILHSARYSPRDQRVFNSVARVEYTSVGILALGGLLYSCLGPYDQEPSVEKAVLSSISMVSLVLTSILLTASISLQIKSNPEREGSKALNWLVAGTTVLFVRSVVNLICYMFLEYIDEISFLVLNRVMFVTMVLADALHSRAVVLQLNNSGPLPVWLLPEIGTGG